MAVVPMRELGNTPTIGEISCCEKSVMIVNKKGKTITLNDNQATTFNLCACADHQGMETMLECTIEYGTA